jgi:hypothetical protein
MPKRTSNEERLQTAEAINIIEGLMDMRNVKGNEIVLGILRKEVPTLKNRLVQLCLPPVGGSKKE